MGLLAELTYRCPLHCPYCSNPVRAAHGTEELSTDEWRDVFAAGRALGVLQVHLSGGEPLARPDLSALIAAAHGTGCYVNLVTSGLGLTAAIMTDLTQAGLDHVQLSVQDAAEETSDTIAGTRSWRAKEHAAWLITTAGLPLTVNAVLHRANIGSVADLADLAASWGAQRLELAHAQYYGWALLNRAALLPSQLQVAAAEEAMILVRARYGDCMDIVYVPADYYERYPKPCMQGWGQRQLVISPTGDVLPCPAAGSIPGLGVENVRDSALFDIWHYSRAFTRFRGTDWMQEPCRSCPRRHIDFGGCRCQAYQLTGDVDATDPVCVYSPHHDVVTNAVADGQVGPLHPRSNLANNPRRSGVAG
jgi:pyrroloquinoline quinone biosynthesis protein E